MNQMKLVCLIIEIICMLTSFGMFDFDDYEIDCSAINSKSNTVFNQSLIGDLIFRNDLKYILEQPQWASPIEDTDISPEMILIPACDNDIKLIIYYASQCDYKIITRSGGHQYSGLSSCSGQCIQIDMSNYTQITKLNNHNFQDVYKIGVDNRLFNVWSALNDDGYFIPHGECKTVGAGGHAQSGGVGIILRQFGANTDTVVAFDIILANGQKKHISSHHNHKNLFYAVRGGGPGSFGVVTDLYFEPLSNDDYPNTVYIEADWLYNNQTMKEIVEIWTYFQSDPEYIDYHDTDLLVHLQQDFPSGQYIIKLFFLWFDDIHNRSWINFGRDYFLNAFLDGVEQEPLFLNETRGKPSELIYDTLVDSTRISPFPYDARQNGVSDADYWSQEFIQQFANDVTEIIDYAELYKSISPIIYLEDYGGRFYSNDPNREKSAIPYRNLKMSILTTLYYFTEEGGDYVKSWNTNKFENYIDNYWYGEDYRMLMTTFGDLNITKEGQDLNHYQDRSI